MAMMMVVIRVAGDEILAMLNLDQVWVATAEVVRRGWRGWQREVGRTLRIGIIMIICSVTIIIDDHSYTCDDHDYDYDDH